MIVTHGYTRIERNVIPPRCRKPRDVYHSGQRFSVEVPEVTGEQAPVAFRERDILAKRWVELRWYDGQLWDKHRPWSSQDDDTRAGDPRFPDEVGLDSNRRYYSQIEAEAELSEWAAGFLIVDGVVYQRTPEPCYYVATFGFGGNHGGTGLMTCRGINSSVSMLRHFTAAQFEQARAGAIAIAVNRGDTQSAEHLRALQPGIEILLPEAQTLRIPVTYKIAVRYVEEVNLEVVADDEDRAREDALSKVIDDDEVRARRTWAKPTLLSERTHITHVELAKLGNTEDD